MAYGIRFELPHSKLRGSKPRAKPGPKRHRMRDFVTRVVFAALNLQNSKPQQVTEISLEIKLRLKNKKSPALRRLFFIDKQNQFSLLCISIVSRSIVC